MNSERHRRRRDPLRRNTRLLLMALLGVSAVVPVVLLSLRSDRQSKEHREVAEAALQDYTALAANEFAQRLNRTLTSEKVVAAFRPFYRYSGAYLDHKTLPKRSELFVLAEGGALPEVGGVSAVSPEEDVSAITDPVDPPVTVDDPPPTPAPAPAPEISVEELIRRNEAYYLVRRYFYHDLTRGQLRVGAGLRAGSDPLWEEQAAGRVPDEAEQRWLAQRITDFATQDHEYYGARGLLYGLYEGQRRAYMCSLYFGSGSDRPTVGYGFEMQLDELQELFQECADLGPVLPGPLIQRVEDPHPATITLRSADGEVLFRTGEPVRGSRTSRRALGPALGDLIVEAALRPDVADQLLSGGLPPSRRPEIWGLLGLSVLLLGLTSAMMRRELLLARLRSDFVASVSHELRTPLTQIRLFADTLLLGRFRSDEDRVRSLKVIDRETRRLDHLLENVLQFARTERQEVQIDPSLQELRPLVEEVVQTFEPMALARRVRVVFEARAEPAAEIDADALRRVLLNLLDNAVKYGPPGQTVRVGLDADEVFVRLSVDDEGEGIAPEHFPKIWQKYWRAHSAERSAVAGTGIGLAVVKDLIRRHRGEVRVESNPKGGARFVIELPRAREVKAAG